MIFSNMILEISYAFDVESIIFLFTVSLIRYSVFNFRYRYISADKEFNYFHLLLFTFVIRIVILIFSTNIIGMMLGWDGLGVSSYILVIYYGREKSFVAGAVTLLTNRLGDFLIILRIGYLFRRGRINMSYYPEIIVNQNWLFFLLFLGACTKRAQIPFRAWLPAAMAAPTPVSSLVHSSTLVTAGVYLLLRNIIYINSFANMDLLFFIGCITIMMARISAINEKDMKKMVALSTLRQLGLIIIRVGLRSFVIAFMHLIIHAFFKAIMFIATGNLIHTRQSYQSVKNTGRIRIRSPINRSIIVIASIRLIGLPFIASFFSKEPIIELRMVGRRSLLINTFSILGVLITCIYSYRFVILVIGTSRNLLRPRWSNDRRYLLHKGVYLLIGPSFLRGCIISNYYLTPDLILYRSILKYIILLLLGTSLGLIYLAHMPLIKLGEWNFFNIWNLRRFTRGVLNSPSLYWRLETDIYRSRIVNNLLSEGSYRGPKRIAYLTERIFIFRLVTIVPVFLLLVLICN